MEAGHGGGRLVAPPPAGDVFRRTRTPPNLVTRLVRIPFLVDFFLLRELRDEIKLQDHGFRGNRKGTQAPSSSLFQVRRGGIEHERDASGGGRRDPGGSGEARAGGR